MLDQSVGRKGASTASAFVLEKEGGGSAGARAMSECLCARAWRKGVVRVPLR